VADQMSQSVREPDGHRSEPKTEGKKPSPAIPSMREGTNEEVREQDMKLAVESQRRPNQTPSRFRW